MSGAKLSAEQLRRIEENKRKALERLSQKNKAQALPPQQCVSASGRNTNSGFNGSSVKDNPHISTVSKDNCPNVNSSECSLRNTIGYSTSQFQSNSSFKPVTSIDVIQKPSFNDKTPAVRSSSSNVSTNVQKPSTSHSNNNFSKGGTEQSVTTKQDTSASLAERIEQNRLKALAKLAERNNCPKGNAQSNQHSVPNGSVNLSSETNCSKSAQNFQKGANIFSGSTVSSNGPQNVGFSGNQLFNGTGMPSFSGIPVKGECVLIARDRFSVKAGYSAPLIQLIKAMDTKLYGKLLFSFLFSD